MLFSSGDSGSRGRISIVDAKGRHSIAVQAPVDRGTKRFEMEKRNKAAK
jgi:hypothetical protein